MTVPPSHTGLVPGGRFASWDPRPPAFVVVDVDGTLVRPDGTTALELPERVASLQAAGVRVGLATGRMRPSVEELWQRLGARGPHALHNGAEVFVDGGLVACWPLERPQVDALVELAATHDAYLEVYVEHGYYVTDDRRPERDHWDMLGHDPLGFVEDLPDGVVHPKSTFALTRPASPRLLEDIAALGLLAGPAHSPLTPHLYYVNANHPEADKARAVAAAASYLDVDLAATVAIGDGANDVSMFEVAGTAIAMADAAEPVHEAAHLIAPAAADDGAVTALEAVLAARMGAAWPRVGSATGQSRPGTW